MYQILLGRIRPVILFKVVNLVFILVVPVVARSVPEIRQFDAPRVGGREFDQADGARAVGVVYLQDLRHHGIALVLRQVRRRVVLEAVCFENVVRCPCARGVVVVQVEE